MGTPCHPMFPVLHPEMSPPFASASTPGGPSGGRTAGHQYCNGMCSPGDFSGPWGPWGLNTDQKLLDELDVDFLDLIGLLRVPQSSFFRFSFRVFAFFRQSHAGSFNFNASSSPKSDQLCTAVEHCRNTQVWRKMCFIHDTWYFKNICFTPVVWPVGKIDQWRDCWRQQPPYRCKRSPSFARMHNIPALGIRTTIAMESVCNETTVATGGKKRMQS